MAEFLLGTPYLNKKSAKSFCVFFVFFFLCVFCFYFIKISKFALPGVMLMYERTSKDRKKESIDNFFPLFFKLLKGERIQISPKAGHHRPASETPFENGPIMNAG